MVNRVKLARIEKSLTQAQLAERVNVTRQTIGLIEKINTIRHCTFASRLQRRWIKRLMNCFGKRSLTIRFVPSRSKVLEKFIS